MIDLPDPLVPPDVDLRDFPYMPVDITRLFDSEFHALSQDAAWRAGMTLWLKSYHQVPAASVPDDDIALARLAEMGRDIKAWRKIKAPALRGWIKCNDGRLYHPVVAEKALEGWIEKLGQRKSSAAGNASRYKTTFDPAPFDAAIQYCRSLLNFLNPQSRSLSKGLPRHGSGSPVGSPNGTPDGTKKHPDGTINGSPKALPAGSQVKGREASIYPGKEQNSEVVDLETGEVGRAGATQPAIANGGRLR